MNVVYVVQATIGGPVKIGHTSKIDKRMKQLQSCCPFQLNLLYEIEGAGVAYEKYLHRKFKGLNVHGEWFSEIILPELEEEFLEKKEHVHPGIILQEYYIKPSGLSKLKIADKLGLSRTALQRVTNGFSSIDYDMANKIGTFFSNKPEFWIMMQEKYDESM